MAKFWITKYALSGGIQVIEGEAERPDYAPEGVVRRPRDFQAFYLGRDAFESEADALADAYDRRTKKIASLEKQIAKLKKLDFSEGGKQAIEETER